MKNIQKKFRHLFIKLINFWPPLLGAGIRVRFMNSEFTKVMVSMKLRKYNKNYVGTHFGGSLFAMTDPFYMLMLLKNLGPDYVVWDKSAQIHFRKPGTGTVTAIFELTPELIQSIKTRADTQYKVEPNLTVNVCNEAGEVVAEISRVIYVRRKDAKARFPKINEPLR